MLRKLLSRTALLAVVATFAVTSLGFAQDGPALNLQLDAGLSIPVGEDNLNTGMTLGATASYGLTEVIEGVGSLIYNRYSLEADLGGTIGVATGHFPITKLLAGLRYITPPSENGLRYFGQAQAGFARWEANYDFTIDGNAGKRIEVGESSSTDFTWRLGGGVLYDFTPSASVGVSAYFNSLSSVDASHIDLPVFFVRFGI